LTEELQNYLNKEFKSDIKEIKSDVSEIKVDIAKLKVKAGMWGAIGGLIPIAIFIGYLLLRG
jgi:hypothetical protein